MKRDITRKQRFRGLLLGTAVGDALGLPAEGMSRRRAARLFKGSWRHRFLFNRGMVSDDTDHTVFVAQSLLAHPGACDAFARRLAWCLRWWLLALPAGIGAATLKSILRLWIGISPRRSGVFSAGNGPAMRSAPIGAFFAHVPKPLDDFVHASTSISHSDPRAAVGAKAIAYLTAWIVRESLHQKPSSEAFLAVLRSAAPPEDGEWRDVLRAIETAVQQECSVEAFADRLGLAKGVTGYIYHTVPVAAYAWYRHFGDFEKTISAVLNCGGDTDTVGAIAGALGGATVGEQNIPTDWVRGILDWPRGPHLLVRIADRLAAAGAESASAVPVRYFWPGLLLRNVLFLLGVLLHVWRRMLPPY